MIQTEPYDPALQDLFLYEDHTVTWSVPTAGSVVVRRAYAWNPNSLLYPYRRSLEGLSVPYRLFSTSGTSWASTVPYGVMAAAANDPNDPVNKPIWYNSFPPLFRVVGPRMTLWCAHAFGVTDNSRNPALSLADLYTAGSYLDAILTARFIDGDDNIVEIPKSDIEYPYMFDANAYFGSDAVAYPRHPNLLTGDYCDTAVALLADDFPCNPLTLVHAGTSSLKDWYYINAGNLTIQRVVMRTTTAYPQLYLWSTLNSQGAHMINSAEADHVFLHDSGSVFLRELKAPTSAEAGDGIMGIALGGIRTETREGILREPWAANEPWVLPDGLSPWNRHVKCDPQWTLCQQPVYPNTTEMQNRYAAYSSYWQSRGTTYPSFATAPNNFPAMTQSEAVSLQASVAAIRSTLT